MSSTISRFVAQPDGKVIVAGDFTSINGVRRSALARLNADGSPDTTFTTTLARYDTVRAMALQSDGKLIIAGSSTDANGLSRSILMRLHANGSLDPSFISNSGGIWSLAVQPDGKIIIVGQFNTINNVARPGIARLNVDGSLDLTFIPDLQYSSIQAMALQADGKLLIGGSFSTNSMGRSALARLNADGSLDASFAPALSQDRSVHHMALQANGQLVITGSFTSVDSVSRPGLARLNADGSLDPAFDVGSGPNDWVMALAVQPDGKIVIGGLFWAINGVPRGHLARLNADGSLDTTFAASLNADDWIMAIAVQPTGKIVIGGYFTHLDSVRTNSVARLLADGRVDPTFDAGDGPNDGVFALTTQPNGKLVIGGAFTQMNGIARNGIARLNPNGALDSTFSPGSGANDWVKTLALQRDGKLVIGGQFTQVDGVPRAYLARLQANGALDTTFAASSGLDETVWTVAVQPDEKILLGGVFSHVHGVPRQHLARVQGGSATSVEPRLFLTPATSTIYPQQTFEIDLRMSTGTTSADTVDAYLTFDPDALEVVDSTGLPAMSITPNHAVVDIVTYNRVNAQTGQIDFSASRSTSPYLTGTATIATIRFRAKTQLATTALRFVQQEVRQSDLFAGGTSLQAAVEHAAIEISTVGSDSVGTARSSFAAAQAADPPRFAVRPALQQLRVGEVRALDLWADLGLTMATDVEFQLTIDPRVVEIVDATGQPAQKLVIVRVPGAAVTANHVDAATVQTITKTQS
ncbi:MAG: hypothetical protein JOZ51_02820 [Chloroflexi bacterium]|nr:hypothetical protein [Chloroflexota bacterium]